MTAALDHRFAGIVSDIARNGERRIAERRAAPRGADRRERTSPVENERRYQVLLGQMARNADRRRADRREVV